MMVSQSMQEGTKTRHERDVLAAQLVELEKKYRRSEDQASCRIEPNFADRLTEELLKLPDSPIGATVSCLTMFFQADSAIADHALLEHCDIVIGNNADFSFLAGRNCLQVHEFKYLWKTDELSNFTFKTGFRSTIMAALEASNELTVEKNLRLAVYPLIDDIDAPLYRCVIAATIGCDTLPGGISGLGAKRLHVLIDQKKPIDANALIGIVIAAKKGRVTEAELRVVIDALMYEPCNTIELSTAGAISETEYQTRSGIFEYMQWFIDRFDKGISFTNIVDKGYRCIMAAWRAGKQLFLQPAFARSDRKFNTREVNRSSTVAPDRSSNERAVNVATRAGVLKRGLRPNESSDVIADVWIAWGFQANFMYKPVL